MDQIIEIISWIGALQGLLLTLLLFSRRNNKSANRLLAFFIVIITLDCLEPIIFNGDHNGILFKTWEVVWGGLVFLHGPLLFLYVKKMTTGAPILQNTDVWHYAAPFIYYLLILSTVVFSWPGHAIETGTAVVYELFFLHLLIYSALSLARIRKYQRSRLANTSSLSTIDLSWLKMLLLTTLALYTISFITVQLQIIIPDAEVKSLNFVIQFFLVFIMYAISYKSISQPQIFFPIRDGGKVNGISKEKYSASSLDQENAERIRRKLSGHMQEKKPYLDPNLSLETLSQQIGESRYHVSQVLNDKFKVKFNDFVNRYRVEEFKLLILKPVRRKPTVESLAQLSGFNSKTSFHTVFKKITGKTPSKFYKEVLAAKNKEVL
ncbi:MAG TPA: helix-turn-helix domain-containing protein [Chryseolinea sp.]